MNRIDVISILIGAMNSDDVGIFVGNSLCLEANTSGRLGNLYIISYDSAISMAVGMAMCTPKRVFVFCDDEYFLRNISETIHAAISRCKNLYVVLLNSNVYGDVGNHPTIYKSIMSPRNLLFDMGFAVHDYKRQLSNMPNPEVEIRKIWEKVAGPLAITIEVSRGYQFGTDGSTIDQKSSIESITDFVCNSDGGY